MSQFNIDEIEKRTLSGLKDFQRATVERVDYLFRHNQNRVLVADEVGMGKTLIARGAIVKTARLRIEEKDDLSIISICRSQQLSLILLMADAGMIIPIGRMYLNTVKMAVFRQ